MKSRTLKLAACCLLAGVAVVARGEDPETQAAAPAVDIEQAGPATRTASLPAASYRSPQQVQLTHEVADLRGLLAGTLPTFVALPSLFEIDLSDETAVVARVQTLRERLTVTIEPGAVTVADPELQELRQERNRLRLEFLSLPVEQRNTLREQDRLVREGKALAEEQRASAAALAATEQARDDALAVASATDDEGARWLAIEEARLQAHRSELAALRQSWAMGNQGQLALRKALLSRYAAIDAGEPISPKDADTLYGTIRDDLRALRNEATRALDALGAPTVIQTLEPGPAAPSTDVASSAQAEARLAPLRKAIADEEVGLAEREAQERYDDAQQVMTTLRTLQARRVALLPNLSPNERARVTGFTAAGVQRVLSEVAHVRLMARWYPLQRRHAAEDFAALLDNSFAAGRIGASLVGLLLGLVALLVIRRRSRRWLGRLRAWLSHRVQPRTLMLRVDGLMKMLIAIVPELTLLAAVYLLFDHVLLAEGGVTEVGTLRLLAYSYAWYALALAFIHRVLLTAVSRYRTVSPALNDKILGSLQLVARLILSVSLYLILAQALLGRGALFGIARSLAVIGAVLVGWRLIRRWRAEVTSAYLNLFPTGALAERVRTTQGRSHGLLIAAAAFVFVAARGLWIWVRDLALSFEQTRKALAYLFRRQLERQSKNQPAVGEGKLPPELLSALTEEPADAALSIDHYPHLPVVLAVVSRMSRGGPGALLALTGERGAGKTSWLMALQREVGTTLPCRRYTFEHRDATARAVALHLSRALGVEETADPAELIERALQAPPQVVLLDLCQNLMLRTVGGLDGYELFVKVAQATAGRVLWVATFARWPFEYLQRLHAGRDTYDHTIALQPWSEPQISALLDARMAKAGFIADYDQMLLNLPGMAAQPTPGASPLDIAERNADRYHRLIWDYADGNPRVALHFFRLSLVWIAGTKVTVRLFPMPAGNALDGFKPRTQFVLSCLTQHENITATEASTSLRFPYSECKRALEILHAEGFLAQEPGGRYRVTSHWNRAVLRFLQRKKLLVV